MGLSACRKSDVTAEQAAADNAKIQAYIKANVVNPSTFTKDPSGVYYSVLKTGTGSFPTASSTVQVAYTGKLLNGTVFDSRPNTQLALNQTIKGWQIAVPKINITGRITFIVPSTLAYGVTGSGAIPANAPLIFTIDLIGFNN